MFGVFQEALELHRPQFVSQSRERMKRLDLLVEERRLQTVFNREREELFSCPAPTRPLIQGNLTVKGPSTHCVKMYIKTCLCHQLQCPVSALFQGERWSSDPKSKYASSPRYNSYLINTTFRTFHVPVAVVNMHIVFIKSLKKFLLLTLLFCDFCNVLFTCCLISVG